MEDKESVLEGKNILFFAPAFFGYEFKIKLKMEEMGATVDLFDERSVTSAFERAILKVSPALFEFKSRQYYHNILEKAKKNYDYILFIKGEMVPVTILQEIRQKYANAKMCLYLYDSVRNIPGILKKINYFDAAYSFDQQDCQQYPTLKMRSLFFLDEFRKKQTTKNDYKYDISFCGTVHSDRYRIIKDVEKICSDKGYVFYLFGYLQSKFMYYYYKITKREFKNTLISMFQYEKLSSKEVAKIAESSKVILDIQHPKQTGLTMRTIEMIGMEKKLITTNTEILQYDFYRPENICVIDREHVQIDDEFMKVPYGKLSKEIYEKYSLDRWVLNVLGIES